MSNKLNENQYIAIQMLAGGSTCSAIADKLKVRKETISRWKQQPEFQEELSSLMDELRETGKNRLVAMMDKALSVIEDDLHNNKNRQQRVRSAFKVLQLLGNANFIWPHKPSSNNADDDFYIDPDELERALDAVEMEG